MPSHPTLVIKIMAILIGGGVVTAAWIHRQPPVSPIDERKLASLLPSQESRVRTHKLKPAFSLTLENSDFTEAVPAGSAFELVARVEVEKSFSALHYEWILPTGVRLESGAASGVVSSPSVRSPVFLTARFTNLTEENKKIHLRVWDERGQGRQSQSVQYNTRDQQDLLVNRKMMAERQNEYLLDHPEIVKKFK